LEGSAQNQQDCTQADKSSLWIDEAARSLDEARKTGVEIPNLAMVDEQLQRRRLDLRSKCPEMLP
jgi:putative aminopeptidase FrvX